MKTILKLHIVLIILLPVSLFAGQVNNNLQMKKNGDILKAGQSHHGKLVFQTAAVDEIDQPDSKSKTSIDITVYNAPEILGGFENHFSAQFILPDTGTTQQFSKQLRI